ncbi:hypothetical protein POM88_002633 [Heracleum sosnowskyi]|uniref:Uncharacterized protein n=1 Tax=Heracleum sosnowskyi TaxID=360622 RepID=A0AAD8JFW4_9APIA|nr:hypothetical protein POM88_002633 [Heracleum sosnowskyi]
MYGILFPHFHALGELLGNDRATGSHVEHFSDAIENMGNETSESMFSACTEEGDQEIDTHLGKLVASESDDMTSKVMDALTQMEGLSSDQVLEAAEILMAESHKLKVFNHANAELRREYI